MANQPCWLEMKLCPAEQASSLSGSCRRPDSVFVCGHACQNVSVTPTMFRATRPQGVHSLVRLAFIRLKEDNFNANSVMFSKLLMHFLAEGR